MWRHQLVVGVLALGVLGCNKLGAGESGIRGRVPVGEDSWAPAPGEQICASKHEESDEPICATIGRDGSFELPLAPGTYWLCARAGGERLSCSSLCPYPVSTGEVTEVEPADLSTPMPDGQGFYGTSTGSFGEPGYLDVPHPLRVCVGPPDTAFRAPISTLTCTQTDRCGRYVLSVPEGNYRVLTAEIGEDTTSDRQRCLYRVSAGQVTKIDRVTGRGAPREPASCAEGSTPDPITPTELAPALRELAEIDPAQTPHVIREELVRLARARSSTSGETLADELQIDIEWLMPILAEGLLSDPALRLSIPPFITTDGQHIAYPRSSEYYEADDRVVLRGPNFLGEPGSVTLRRVGSEETIEIARASMTWDWYEISFPNELPSGRYVVSVRRPDGLASYPREAIVSIGDAPAAVIPAPAPEPTGAPEGPESLTAGEIKAALEPVKPAVLACGSKHHAAAGASMGIQITVAGATGEVSMAERVPEQAETPLSACVVAAAKAASFPTFRRAQMSFSFKFQLAE